MKNNKYFILLFLACITITGCNNFNFNSKELTDEEKLCQNISPSIEKYQNNQITYDNFLNAIKSDYNNYCTNNTSDICISIKSMYSSNEQSTELEDCSKYNGNDSISKSRKAVCESSNDAKKKIIEQKSSVQKASVSQVKRYCD